MNNSTQSEYENACKIHNLKVNLSVFCTQGMWGEKQKKFVENCNKIVFANIVGTKLERYMDRFNWRLMESQACANKIYQISDQTKSELSMKVDEKLFWKKIFEDI